MSTIAMNNIMRDHVRRAFCESAVTHIGGEDAWDDAYDSFNNWLVEREDLFFALGERAGSKHE